MLIDFCQIVDKHPAVWKASTGCLHVISALFLFNIYFFNLLFVFVKKIMYCIVLKYFISLILSHFFSFMHLTQNSCPEITCAQT